MCLVQCVHQRGIHSEHMIEVKVSVLISSGAGCWLGLVSYKIVPSGGQLYTQAGTSCTACVVVARSERVKCTDRWSTEQVCTAMLQEVVGWCGGRCADRLCC